MKKGIYLFAAIALLTSCGQGEIMVDTLDPMPEAPRRIGFDTFVDKATRAEDLNLYNSTALNAFYNTFNVNGWKTVGSDTTCVFDNIPVEFFASDAAGTVVYKEGKPSDEWTFTADSWYYQNIRYWDQMASKYQFCAYAPAAASADIKCAPTGVITIGDATTPITVEGKNLMATPDTLLAFTGFDKDYMTATSVAETSPVSLNFSHLQAKLNIRIKLADDVTTAQDVSVQKIQVHNLCDSAYYVSNATGTGVVDGWTLGTASADYVPKVETAYTLNAATNYHNHYVLEQLIIPQTINKAATKAPSLTEFTNACVYVEYTIGTEIFKSYTPLGNIFDDVAANTTYTFEAGNQYTLNINIGPEPIHFTVSVATWADATEENLNMD